jgi:ATP/maltotriose-dependent transcriptional regulator MalT
MKLTMRMWSRNLRMALGMEPVEMHALMAQLSVLYEDLRIELEAAELANGMTDEQNYRRNYYIRRTTGTLVEIQGALHRLNMNKEFKTLKKKWSKQHLKEWNETRTTSATSSSI